MNSRDYLRSSLQGFVAEPCRVLLPAAPPSPGRPLTSRCPLAGGGGGEALAPTADVQQVQRLEAACRMRRMQVSSRNSRQ